MRLYEEKQNLAPSGIHTSPGMGAGFDLGLSG